MSDSVVFNKLLIIDGSYMLHRNLHMEDLANLKTSTGIKSGGVFGFLRSLNKAMRNCPNDYYPVICWDSKVSPRRLEIYPNYKHNLDHKKDTEYKKVGELLLERPEALDSMILKYSEEEISMIKAKMNEMLTNKELFGSYEDPNNYLTNYVKQRDFVISVCNNLGIPNIKYSEWEGDDLMTLLTRMSRDSIIVSDDSDMRQLINDHISVLRVLKGIQFITIEDVKSMGYEDSRILAIIKAIIGDGSDNIPQVAFRLGYKTAEKIAPIIYKNMDKPEIYLNEIKNTLKGSVIQKFIDNHDDYIRNLKLVDLSYVETDYSVLNYISSVIKMCNINYMQVLSDLGRLEIQSIDIDSIINRVVSSKNKLYEGV